MTDKRPIEELNRDELSNIIVNELGEKPYRADQVIGWLERGARFDEMGNVPKSLRERLAGMFYVSTPQIVKKLTSDDGTVKYLMALDDGNVIETVVMKYRYGYSICLSTQVGCNMGCAFCASAIGGKIRNLTRSEITGQVLAAAHDLGVRISNVVLMGNGEPLDNYDNVLGFIRDAGANEHIGIGQRHISLSTCGLCDGIDRLAEENLQINLCISLHAPNDAVRSKIMPVNRRYPVQKVTDAARRYAKRTGRRVTFEYALIDGVNSSQYMARELADIARGWLCHVNLIPINYVKEHDFRPPNAKTVEAFAQTLKKNHVPVTIRRSLGSDISASCGQLRKGRQGDGSQNV